MSEGKNKTKTIRILPKQKQIYSGNWVYSSLSNRICGTERVSFFHFISLHTQMPLPRKLPPWNTHSKLHQNHYSVCLLCDSLNTRHARRLCSRFVWGIRVLRGHISDLPVSEEGTSISFTYHFYVWKNKLNLCPEVEYVICIYKICRILYIFRVFRICSIAFSYCLVTRWATARAATFLTKDILRTKDLI